MEASDDASCTRGEHTVQWFDLIEQDLDSANKRASYICMAQASRSRIVKQKSHERVARRARSFMSASTLVVFSLGGCGLVSGLDEFEVTTQSSSSSSSGSSGSSAGFVTIGGSVSGLLGTGLVLRNNGTDDIQVGMNGPFTFPAKVQAGSVYDVTVASPPSSPSQSCSVSNGSGTAMGTAITNVTISCSTSAHVIGGTVVGLTGSGLVLTNGGKDDLTVGMNGAFQFATQVPSGSSFDIAVKTQPSSGGPCVVSGGMGVVGNADVTSALVNCAPGTYTVGGTVSGLVGTVVLQNNGTADLNLTSDGSFAFAQTLAPGNAYAVTVSTQPSYPPRSQSCTVTNGTGTMGNANVTNVNVACTTQSYTVGGNVVGSTGPIVLKNNGGDALTVNAAGNFVFPTAIASGNAYSVAVATLPSGQTCSVSNGSGTIANGNVNDVTVNCSTSVGNQGILCGGSYCTLGAQECCLTNGTTYACIDKCVGGNTAPIKCDSAADCTTGLVCCGAVMGTTVNNIFCSSPAQCTAPKAYYCDPNLPTPCPHGGTCMPTETPPGYYRCF